MGLDTNIMPLRRGYLETASPSLNLMLVLLTAYTDFAFGCWEESQHVMDFEMPNNQTFPFFSCIFPVKEKNKRGENTVCYQI